MFKVVHITDPHLGPAGELYAGLDNRARFLRVLGAARKHRPDLYVFGGDYSQNEPDLAACRWLKAQLDTINTPYCVLAGNHDDPDHLNDVFGLSPERPLPRYRAHRRELDGRTHFFLDSATGRIGETQLRWLGESLATAPRPVIWLHHPPALMESHFMDRKHALADAKALQKQLAPHGLIPVLCGHYHANLRRTVANLLIHVCPPTSFYIDPTATSFRQEEYPPAYQLALFGNDREVVLPYYVA